MISGLLLDFFNIRSHGKTLLVTADNDGNIKLFRYPALSKQVKDTASYSRRSAFKVVASFLFRR